MNQINVINILFISPGSQPASQSPRGPHVLQAHHGDPASRGRSALLTRRLHQEAHRGLQQLGGDP